MYAERLILETDVTGKLKQMPLLPANKQLEAIFLVIADSEQQHVHRTPSQDLAGKIKITGNIIDAVPETDWDRPE